MDFSYRRRNLASVLSSIQRVATLCVFRNRRFSDPATSVACELAPRAAGSIVVLTDGNVWARAHSCPRALGTGGVVVACRFFLSPIPLVLTQRFYWHVTCAVSLDPG